MPLRTALLVTLLIAALTLSSCAGLDSAPHYAPWDYADLRALDPADASQPSNDLIAIYTRDQGSDIQIRLDLLEHAPLPDYDLYILLNSEPGGAQELPIDLEPTNTKSTPQWDMMLVIPQPARMNGANRTGICNRRCPRTAISVAESPLSALVGIMAPSTSNPRNDRGR